jgi:hypothetical protein
MKNKKGELVTVMPRAIGAVLIMFACLLGGGASALGQEAGKPVIEPSDMFGKGGTKETTTETSGKTTTFTEVFKDPTGVEQWRVVTFTEPNAAYGEGGTKETFTTTTRETEGSNLTRVTVKDSKKVIREKKETYTYPGQGKRKEEYDSKYDGNGKKTYTKITKASILGEETSYEELKYEKGKQVSGFWRYFDKDGKKHTKTWNPKTEGYEEIALNTGPTSEEISAPPTDTTASDNFQPNEIFGGFSLIREDSEPENFNTYGFQSSYTRNLNKTFGITGDFSANFIERGGVDLSKTSFLGGVNFLPFPGANGDDQVRVFTHALFGVSDFKADSGTASFTDNAFTMKFGGGLDINVNQHFFIRPFEFDYNPTRFGGVWQHNMQINSGLGLRF